MSRPLTEDDAFAEDTAARTYISNYDFAVNFGGEATDFSRLNYIRQSLTREIFSGERICLHRDLPQNHFIQRLINFWQQFQTASYCLKFINNFIHLIKKMDNRVIDQMKRDSASPEKTKQQIINYRKVFFYSVFQEGMLFELHVQRFQTIFDDFAQNQDWAQFENDLKVALGELSKALIELAKAHPDYLYQEILKSADENPDIQPTLKKEIAAQMRKQYAQYLKPLKKTTYGQAKITEFYNDPTAHFVISQNSLKKMARDFNRDNAELLGAYYHFGSNAIYMPDIDLLRAEIPKIPKFQPTLRMADFATTIIKTLSHELEHYKDPEWISEDDLTPQDFLRLEEVCYKIKSDIDHCIKLFNLYHLPPAPNTQASKFLLGLQQMVSKFNLDLKKLLDEAVVAINWFENYIQHSNPGHYDYKTEWLGHSSLDFPPEIEAYFFPETYKLRQSSYPELPCLEVVENLHTEWEKISCTLEADNDVQTCNDRHENSCQGPPVLSHLVTSAATQLKPFLSLSHFLPYNFLTTIFPGAGSNSNSNSNSIPTGEPQSSFAGHGNLWVDPVTGDGIFQLSFFRNKIQIATARLFGQPYPCRSADRSYNNVLEVTGELLDATPQFDDVCATLPSSLLGKIGSSALSGSSMGMVRGFSQGLANCTTHNVLLQKTQGFGLYYLFNFIWQLIRNNTKGFHDTKNLMTTEIVLTIVSLLLNVLGRAVKFCGEYVKTNSQSNYFQKTSGQLLIVIGYSFVLTSQLLNYSWYACQLFNTYYMSMVPQMTLQNLSVMAPTSMISGYLSQFVFEYLTSSVVNKCLTLFNRSNTPPPTIKSPQMSMVHSFYH